jgi:hypothetical protein
MAEEATSAVDSAEEDLEDCWSMLASFMQS